MSWRWLGGGGALLRVFFVLCRVEVLSKNIASHQSAQGRGRRADAT